MRYERPRIEKYWQPRLGVGGRLAWLPLAASAGLFRAATAARNVWWRRMAVTPPITTVSVGNLTVGGSSKTPFTLFLAKRLQGRGLAVGIVSRGWGRRVADEDNPLLVADGGRLLVVNTEAGDEPAMMARSFDGPIAVSRRRIDAIRLLASQRELDVVLLDDGFQHTRLRRDLDLVLISRERGVGNGWTLPAGPMREPLRALKRADAVILISSAAGEPPGIAEVQVARLERRPLLRAAVRPRSLVSVEQGEWLESAPVLARRRTLVISGLADSRGFYAMLRELDADLIATLEYPDHHEYSLADWQAISNAARDAEMIVTTEKDLVKLERFPFPRDSLYALRVEITIAESDARMLDELVLSRLRPRPKSGASTASANQENSRDAS